MNVLCGLYGLFPVGSYLGRGENSSSSGESNLQLQSSTYCTGVPILCICLSSIFFFSLSGERFKGHLNRCFGRF